MNRRMGIIALSLVLALSTTGCKKGQEEPADANQTTAAQLKDKADQALQGAGELLARQKDRLLTASQEQLGKLEQTVNGWIDDVDTDDQQVRQRLNAMSQSFRTTLGEARQAIDKARDSGIDAWQEVKPTVEAALTKARQAHDEVMAYLKEQARKAQESEAESTGPVVEE